MRISNKAVSFLAVGLFAAGLSIGAIGGCSSSSSGSSYKELCMQGCAKIEACNPDAGALIATYCQASCNQTCSNESARISAGQACLKMSDCTAFEACGQAIPGCQSTTGGAGSSGTGGASTGTGGTTGGAGHTGSTGGTTGGAGSGGTPDCSVCTTFVNSGCCASVLTAGGQSTSSCSSLPAACTASPSVATTCQQGITTGKQAGLSGC